MFTVGVSGQKVPELVGRSADLDGGDPHRKPGPGLLLLLVDAPEQPRNGAGDDAQRVRAFRTSEHRVRFTWNG